MQRMAEATASLSNTQVVTEIPAEGSRSPTLALKLRKPKNDKKVKWTTETVDNEHLNKKKSKCCCIYEKPRMFGESSDEDDDECGHCRGHKKKCFRDEGGENMGEPDGSEQPGTSGS
ncbi:E3 ubiquitin-protein ligase PPP1R11-like [Mya arenaria]|uniref:E3 ubiquitin-protein ligase PPP1R11-like n=1 Tax=Mya arenaria TaxID=6604 RepID=UPI0022E12FAF|nr:E3 ubiquitin-protein ligase PPP1R11-like [Mya arenaria]